MSYREILNMLLEIAENGLEGDQDLATLMEQIYQAEGTGEVIKEGENEEEVPRVMNQEEFEALYMKSQINESVKEKEESPVGSPDIEGKAMNQGIITKEDWEAISKNNLSQIMQKPERDPHMY